MSFSLALGAIIVVAVAAISVRLRHFYQTRKRFTEAIERLPGPPGVALPLVANAKSILLYQWATRGQFDKAILIYQEVQAICRVYRDVGIFKYWVANVPFVVVFAPELVESILSAPNQTTKSMIYFAFKPWLGEGLVTSEGNKWRSRRRIITPAFHFNILNDFLPALDAAASKLIKRLNDVKYTKPFDIGPVVSDCTMDIICETAMGIESDFQSNESTEWTKAVHEVTKLVVRRMTTPWMWLDRPYYWSATGKEFVKYRDYMHALSMKVILERKAEWVQRMEAMDGGLDMGAAWQQQASSSLKDLGNSKSSFQPSGFARGRPRVKMAFLDMMLYHHLVEKSLTLKDIQEEVDTFMFAGQDTTAVTISWTLYMLGLHPEIQDRVRRELDEIFVGDDQNVDDSEEGLTFASGKSNSLVCETNYRLKLSHMTCELLAQMKYLEMVIKETLRYWPTVPNVSRSLTEDLLIGGKYLAPSGSIVSVHFPALHHDPRWFPKPEIYDPERFSSENISRRHPYAFIPFSAGPRNCVGQKFAMMEAKVILAKIIRNYRIVTTNQMDRLRVVGEVVLKSETGLPVRLEPLHTQKELNK